MRLSRRTLLGLAVLALLGTAAAVAVAATSGGSASRAHPCDDVPAERAEACRGRAMCAADPDGERCRHLREQHRHARMEAHCRDHPEDERCQRVRERARAV